MANEIKDLSGFMDATKEETRVNQRSDWIFTYALRSNDLKSGHIKESEYIAKWVNKMENNGSDLFSEAVGEEIE